jgi:mRNA interferase RelE/StbE
LEYGIRILPKAQRQIRSLPQDVQRRIRAAVDTLKQDPLPQGAKKLVALPDLYRVRVGDYRIVYAIQGSLLVILIVSVGHRKEVYRSLSTQYSSEYVRSILEDD